MKQEISFGQEVKNGINWIGNKIQEFLDIDKPDPKGVHSVIFKGKKADLIEKAEIDKKVQTKTGQIKDIKKKVKNLIVTPSFKKSSDALILVHNKKVAHVVPHAKLGHPLQI